MGVGRSKGVMKKVLATLGALLSIVYLINPTMGVFEILPDNLPGVGNIDEAAVTALLIGCLRAVGFDPLKVFGRKQKSSSKKDGVIDVE